MVPVLLVLVVKIFRIFDETTHDLEIGIHAGRVAVSAVSRHDHCAHVSYLDHAGLLVDDRPLLDIAHATCSYRVNERAEGSCG